MNEKKSFDTILKSTTLFGGVEFIKILIQIIRSKVLAVLLGPVGIGLYGLLTTSTGIVTSFTNSGLDVSGVKFLASNSSEKKKKSESSMIYKSLIIFSSIIGFVLMILFSPILSAITFQNFEYIISFSLLSFFVFFNQLSNGNNSFLRAYRKQKDFAKSTIYSSIFGLLLSIPIYYFFELEGIVPSLIITAIIYFLTSHIINKKDQINIFENSIKHIRYGYDVLKMGFVYSMSSLLIIIASFLIQIFIKINGDIFEVGLYLAAIAIVNNYVNLIFKAMAIDYFPRLSKIKNNTKSNQLVNQQSILSLILLSPILIILIVFIKPFIQILYSSEFLYIDTLIQLLTIGVFFRTMSWSIAYLFLAKGNSKLFFKNELFFNIYFLAINMIFYLYWGLTGLGFAFIFSNILYFFQVSYYARVKYFFKPKTDYIKILIFQLLMSFSLLIINYYDFIIAGYWYILGLVFIFISSYYSFKNLKDRSNLISDVLSKIWKK